VSGSAEKPEGKFNFRQITAQKERKGMKTIFRSSRLLYLVVLAMSIWRPGWAQVWKFGVISDTQWTIANDGKNPNTCAADIIKQVNQRFIANRVKFVIAVGDMVDQGSQINDYTRALYAQDLYNANIGFYPLRGNHEAAEGTPAYMNSGVDFTVAYPQIVPGLTAGWNNNTPATSIFTSQYQALASTANPPASKTNPVVFPAGTNFSFPTSNASTGGVSYSFRYSNATFVLLDQFKSPNYYYSDIPDQQSWISQTLSSRPPNTHAFALTHKNILGGNHKDNMFGGPAANDPGDGYGIADPSTPVTTDSGTALTVGQKQAAENAFLASLQANKVRYMISGHDHHHYNSVVTSPDQKSKVHQLICQSDSSKFYTPTLPVSGNDASVEQDLARVGYYIFTVDGPRVTIDYYADSRGNWQSGGSFPFGTGSNYQTGTTPTLDFVKRSTTGYSLNGKEKMVAQGAPYDLADDTKIAATMGPGFKGTSMAILAGVNGSHATANYTAAANSIYSKPTQKAVNTGWAPAEAGLASDILTLWGMADLGSEQTDTFVLSLSFDKQDPRQQLGNGGFGIAARGADGQWGNVVDKNFGGDAPQFVMGPWNPSYGLNTYGVDPSTKTAWAVINHAGDFAVMTGIEPPPGHRK
jgi:hypothetical protein